jgi:hypothetical protein
MTRFWHYSVALLLGCVTFAPAWAQQNQAQNDNIQQAADLLLQQQAAAQVNPNAGVKPAQGVNALPGQGRVPPPPNNLGNNMQGQPFINPDNLLDEWGAPLRQRQNQLGQRNQMLINRAQQLRQQGQQNMNNGSGLADQNQQGGIVGAAYMGGLGGAATIEESILTGQARHLQGAGEYNRNSADAIKTLQLAQAIALENARTGLKTYFELKQMNLDYRYAKNGPLTKEKLDEWNRQDQPTRLSPAEYNIDTGSIRWPALLQVQVFDDQRIVLEELFARRTANDFGPKSDFYRQVATSTQILKDRLKEALRSNDKFFNDEEYVTAQNFLSSLTHEARLAPILDGLVAQ